MNREQRPAGALNSLCAARDPLPGASLRELAEALRHRLRGAGDQPLPADAADHLGALSIELEVGADQFANRFSRCRAAELFAMAAPWLAAGRLPRRGATVVELGCGAVNPLGALLVHVLAGAARAIGIDPDPPQDVAGAVRALARIATYMLAEPALLAPGLAPSRADVARCFAGFDLIRLWQGDPGGIDERRLQLRRERAERTGLAAASVDLTYSVSFLEHVPDPAALVAELARITRPGGLGVHAIDGRDHRGYADAGVHPLAFLRDDTGDALVHGSNRVRPLQFADVFARGGFDVEGFEVHERVDVPDALRDGFAPRFRDLDADVLGVTGGFLRVRRR